MKKCIAALVPVVVVVGIAISEGSARAEESASPESLNLMLRMEARTGRVRKIEELVRRGADVNGRGDYDETALYSAVLYGQVAASIRLIQLGAEPDAKGELGRSALLRASEDCNSTIVDVLLKKGADINQADYYGRTALMNAVESGCVRTVALLLTKGRGKIDLDARDNSFRSAEDYAELRGHPWIQEMLALAQGKGAENPTGTVPKIRLP